jgi:uncharacterized membrane protein
MNETPSSRYAAVDALRGLIMMLMAIDHASAFIARQHGSEFWAGAMSAYRSAFPFLTRWITHLCAPGFFFLMGAGIYWSAARRGQRSPVRGATWRGVVILLCGQLFEGPLALIQGRLKPAAVSLNTITAPPPVDGSTPYWIFIVLTGLGLVMVVCGLLLPLRPWMWLVVSALCVIATNSLMPASGAPGSWWAAMLLTPGLSQHIFVLYPVIPWLAVAAAGMYFGYWWRTDPDRAARKVWIIGLALLCIGIAVRAAGGWGNIRLPRDTGWIEFLNNVKYPPSLVYWTMALGIDLLLLAMLIRLPDVVKSRPSPLIVFGQTPLFFYVAHFYLLAALAFAIFKEATSLQMAYVIWVVILAVLYPICAKYRDFKLAKPSGSFWRYL